MFNSILQIFKESSDLLNSTLDECRLLRVSQLPHGDSQLLHVHDLLERVHSQIENAHSEIQHACRLMSQLENDCREFEASQLENSAFVGNAGDPRAVTPIPRTDGRDRKTDPYDDEPQVEQVEPQVGPEVKPAAEQTLRTASSATLAYDACGGAAGGAHPSLSAVPERYDHLSEAAGLTGQAQQRPRRARRKPSRYDHSEAAGGAARGPPRSSTYDDLPVGAKRKSDGERLPEHVPTGRSS